MDSLFSVDGHVVENVQDFIYLGQSFTNNEENCLTDYRIARATAKFNELRKALCDSKIRLKTRRKLLESVVRSRLTYGLQACYPSEEQLKKLETCWFQLLRSAVRGGWKRHATGEEDAEEDYRLVYTNQRVEELMGTLPLRDHINKQYLKYIGHVCRLDNFCLAKVVMFAEPSRRYYWDPWLKISRMMGVSVHQAKKMTQSRAEFAGSANSLSNPPQRRNHR